MQRYGIFDSLSASPGESMIAAIMVPRSKKIPYMIRADVEFLHPGPLLQQQLTAVDVKQHAMDAAHPPKLKIAPIAGGSSKSVIRFVCVFFCHSKIFVLREP